MHLNVWIIVLIVVFAGFLLLHVFFTQKMARLSRRNEDASKILEWSWLAQRLAHEIKNPLSTVNLTVQRILEVSKKKFGPESKVLDVYVNSILEEVERIRDTTDKFIRILNFDQPALEPANLNTLLEKVLKRYEPTLPRGIRLKKVFALELPFVRCDENQIRAMLSNILENAIDALDGKGTVTVSTGAVENLVRDRLRPRSEPKRERLVEVRIEDDGPGISPEDMKNLFKPFHTTKASGSGFGLVIAKRIAESHKGRIEITSRLGAGTLATISLPAV